MAVGGISRYSRETRPAQCRASASQPLSAMITRMHPDLAFALDRVRL